MKKIAVIGKGTAGSQTILFLQKNAPSELEWYFDPLTPVQTVGEGATLILPLNLSAHMGFRYEDLPKINGTIKLGILKENWGLKNKKYFHHFQNPSVSYHFNAVKLQEHIFSYLENKVKIIDKAVSPEKIDADFIYDCSGSPNNMTAYYESDLIPVNSAFVTQCYWKNPTFNYTLSIARPYGWVFGIPLTNRCSIGYLYNSAINSISEIKEDVKNLFTEYNLDPSDDTNHLSFNNYYRKTNFSKRVAYNGNASFFLEPLEATSIQTIDYIQRLYFNYIFNNASLEDINNHYSVYMKEIETMIMMHYYANSPFDTKFWQEANKKGMNTIHQALDTDHNFQKIIKTANLDIDINLCRTLPISYGTWCAGSWKENLQGLGILLEK